MGELTTSERRRQVLALVRASDFVRVPDLAERFGVSTVTVRADLDALAKRGHLVRVHGGAVPSSASGEHAFESRQELAAESKVAIAEAVADMLEPGATLILDVGTTTMAIARAIVARPRLENVVVFTNGLNVAMALEPAIPRLEVVVTGGHLRPRQHSLVEPGAVDLFAEIRADYAFIGCDGIHPERGITTTNIPEARMKQAMVAAAHQRVVVADSSKFLREALITVCPLDEIDVVVTAGELADDAIGAFSGASLEIRHAPTVIGDAAQVYRFPLSADGAA